MSPNSTKGTSDIRRLLEYIGLSSGTINLIEAEVDKEVNKARIDELSHIQLEYGGRYGATTYIDGDGQALEARIAELKLTNREDIYGG